VTDHHDLTAHPPPTHTYSASRACSYSAVVAPIPPSPPSGSPSRPRSARVRPSSGNPAAPRVTHRPPPLVLSYEERFGGVAADSGAGPLSSAGARQQPSVPASRHSDAPSGERVSLVEMLRSGSVTPDIHEDRIVAVSLPTPPVSPKLPLSARPRSGSGTPAGGGAGYQGTGPRSPRLDAGSCLGVVCLRNEPHYSHASLKSTYPWPAH
jgi:hypothetical protein